MYLEPIRHACSLCEREFASGRYLTEHHLLPRSKGGQKEHVAQLCGACHSTVHATFTNATLAQAYASVAALREAPELRPYLRWVRRQDPHRRIHTRRRRVRR